MIINCITLEVGLYVRKKASHTPNKATDLYLRYNTGTKQPHTMPGARYQVMHLVKGGFDPCDTYNTTILKARPYKLVCIDAQRLRIHQTRLETFTL